MSNTNKHNATYSAADIERYLRGELSSREMHDLENAALEDPFLADALDGISMHVPSAANLAGTPADSGLGQDLDEIRSRLNARISANTGSADAEGPVRPGGTGKAKVRRLSRRLSVAAAIILLLGIGCTIYYISFTGATGARSPAVASSPPRAGTTAPLKDETPPSSATPAEQPSQATTTAPALVTTTTPPLSEQRRQEFKARRADITTSVTDANPKARPDASSKAIPDKLSTADAEADTVTAAPGLLTGRVGGIALGSSARNDMAREFFNQSLNSLVVKGTVLDNHDNPVRGASLMLKGYTNTGTVTDQQGQFSLHLLPQDSTRYLTVAMVGFEQKSLPLNALTADDVTGHVIHLQPNEASLDEVVITGFGSKRKETLAAAPSDSKEELDSLWQKAQPVIGRNAYLDYLNTAQKGLSLDSSVTGTETVSFEVDKKGTLTSFKIQQSLSPAHDEAIIRLVKEGPVWQLLKHKKVRAVVSLHF